MTAYDEPTQTGHDVTVFSADSAATNVVSSIAETWRYRSFVSYMTKRDLRTTYLRSYFGWIWSLINPIAEVLIYTLVFGVLLDVARAVPDAPNGFNSFPHFLLSGFVTWGFFRMVSTKILNSFVGTVKLRRKLYFPPAAIAVSTTLSTMVQSSMLIVVLFVFFALWGHFTIHAVVIIAAAVFASAIGLGVGLGLAVFNSRYKDVGYLYSIFMRLGFYLLPLIWPIESAAGRFGGAPWLEPFVTSNPLARLIGFGRTGILFQRWPPLSEWIFLSGFSLFVLLAGWAIFARVSPDVAEGL